MFIYPVPDARQIAAILAARPDLANKVDDWFFTYINKQAAIAVEKHVADNLPPSGDVFADMLDTSPMTLAVQERRSAAEVDARLAHKRLVDAFGPHETTEADIIA